MSGFGWPIDAKLLTQRSIVVVGDEEGEAAHFSIESD